jgi:VIT1/CCC1 family predicted Fe2+/Mn2+ transporter
MSESAAEPSTGATVVTPSTTVTTRGKAVAVQEPSIGQLVADASRDVSALIQNEIALAKAELKVSVRAGGLSVGLFASAGFVLMLGVIMLSVAIAYFIHMTGLDLAWCFLIVFLLYAIVAAVLGLVGARKAKTVRPPERAIHQAQETKNTLMRRS